MLRFTRFTFIGNFDSMNTWLVLLRLVVCIAHPNSKKLELVVIEYAKITRPGVSTKKPGVFTKIPGVFTANLKKEKKLK